MDVLTILGPTASGKTALAVAAARALDAEVVSVDSRQVYRSLDIGSGKDRASYAEVPVHLLDVVDPGVEFSLFDFLKRAQAVQEKLQAKARTAIYAGGTGLYLDALLKGYALSEAPPNPVLRAELAALPHEALVARLEALKPLHNSTDTQDRDRTLRALEVAEAEALGNAPSVSLHLQGPVIGIELPPAELKSRIRDRLYARFEEGLLEEVSALIEQGIPVQWLEHIGLEYRYLSRFLKGELNRNDMEQQLLSEINRFARQQRKWFRRMERQGIRIHWVKGQDSGASQLDQLLSYRCNYQREQAQEASRVAQEAAAQSPYGTSFDALEPRFQKNIYGSLKGRIRLAVLSSDLQLPVFKAHFEGRPCQVLDAGCGAAPLSRDWAAAGHRVSLVDLSQTMLNAAEKAFQEAEISPACYQCHPGALQQILPSLPPMDVVFLHAVLEWVKEPRALLHQVLSGVAPEGVVSLTFYNLHGFVYRRLLQGNFKNLEVSRPREALGDLTPIYPLTPEEMEEWVNEAGFEVVHRRGVRCFVDYQHPRAVPHSEEELLAQELAYSQQEPFINMARYIHWVLRRKEPVK